MSMPSSRALVAARPRSSPGAQRLPRARGAPRAGSRRGRRPPGRPASASTSASRRRAVEGDGLRAPARADEGERAHPLDDQVGEQVGRPRWSAARRTGAPFSPATAARTAAPRAPARCRPGDPSAVTAARRARSAAGGDLRLGHGGRGEHERGVGAVQRGRRGAAGAAPGRRGRRTRPGSGGTRRRRRSAASRRSAPAGVAGQQGAVQHVGVGEHVLRVVARPLPLSGVGRRRGCAHAHVRRPSPRSAGELVLRRAPWWAPGRGRRRRAGRWRPRLGLDGVQRGHQVGQRLARRRPGRDHDVPTREGRVGAAAPGGVHGRGYAAGLERRPVGSAQPRGQSPSRAGRASAAPRDGSGVSARPGAPAQPRQRRPRSATRTVRSLAGGRRAAVRATAGGRPDGPPTQPGGVVVRIRHL